MHYTDQVVMPIPSRRKNRACKHSCNLRYHQHEIEILIRAKAFPVRKAQKSITTELWLDREKIQEIRSGTYNKG